MTEVTNKQLAKWTKRCNGIAIWDTEDGCSYMGICGAGNAGADINDKRCKRRQQKWLSGKYYPEGVCIGHYGLPYPNRCPICKSSKNLEICGLENSRDLHGLEQNYVYNCYCCHDNLHNVYICCNENGCNTILVNYMIEGQLNDYSDVIPDYKDMTKQLFGMEESK